MDFSLGALSEWVSALPGGETLWMILMFIVVLSILVFFHELGHYSAARSVGVRVTAFSIGFGRELWGWNDKHGTRWKVCLVPLGGYVQMFGDDKEAKLTDEEKQEAFLYKNVWQRIWVVAAGPLANFILAIIFLAGLMMHGEQVPLPKIGTVFENSAAQEAGIQEGDLILSVDEQPIMRWDDVVAAIKASKGEAITLGVERAGELVTLEAKPKIAERENWLGEKVIVPFMGISPNGDSFTIEHGFTDAVVLGFVRTYELSEKIVISIGKMLTGAVSADNIGGPIMIAEIAGKAGEQGLYALVMFMVIISINLGLINLLPIPVLDGGHLLFYFIEAIKGSPLGEKTQEVGYRVGFALVMTLMVFAIGNDVLRVFDKWQKDETATPAVEANK